MIIKKISVSELESYIKSEEYLTSAVVPISVHRALSQIKNPRASSDDIILILAKDKEGRILAYAGALPDTILYQQEEKIAWNSCWWADPNLGKGAALPILLAIMQYSQNKMLFADLTPQTKLILEKTNLCAFHDSFGVKAFLRCCLSSVLPPKFPFLKRKLPRLALTFIDAVVNSFINPVHGLLLMKINANSNYKLEYIKEIDAEAKIFIEHHQSNDLFRRSEAEINWILTNPWVLQTQDRKFLQSKRYYFSSYCEHFRNQLIKIYHHERLVAVLFLTDRDGNFKIPYLWSDSRYSRIVMQVIYQLLLEQRAITFTTFQPHLIQVIRKDKSPFFYTRKIPRYFATTNALKNIPFSKYNLQDGEGDVVFT
jgi:hypothetical protein